MLPKLLPGEFCRAGVWFNEDLDELDLVDREDILSRSWDLSGIGRLVLDRLPDVFDRVKVTNRIYGVEPYERFDREFVPERRHVQLKPKPLMFSEPEADHARSDRPFRVLEGDAVWLVDDRLGRTLDEMIESELDDFYEGLDHATSLGKAAEFIRGATDRAIWQLDENHCDRLLAVIQVMPGGSPSVIRLYAQGKRPDA